MKKISKILIANRGEIALRVIKTARLLGYRSVAVFSEADKNALHVIEADQAVSIGGFTATESYLNIESIIQAAKKSGADAIHPGYGFLSENAEFAKACAENGIIFIGPKPESITLMSSKRLSKLAMLDAGVPCIPGYQDAEQKDDVLFEKAKEIGFPVMVKASAGGGGRGMRLVNQASDFVEQLKTARSEALNAFGSDELILEKAVVDARHIEIQVFADNFGNAVYLGERDCSIQRRHQKVVEEAPSPFVDENLRKKMGQAAVDVALACDYQGAGTVEFLVDENKDFYFLEMNTRLQVEHPVTEMITGEDLVEWQIRVADGEKLPKAQQDISLSGHAMEVRLYAEDPRNQFLPQTGLIRHWQLPSNTKNGCCVRSGIRVDHGIQPGQKVSIYYDPMLAKVIAYGDSRVVAARKLAAAIEDTQLLGLNNNKYFLQNILRQPLFLEGKATIDFLEKHFSDDNSIIQKFPTSAAIAKAAVLMYATQLKQRTQTQLWSQADDSHYQFKLNVEGETKQVFLSHNGNGFTVKFDDEIIALNLISHSNHIATFEVDGLRSDSHYYLSEHQLYIDDGSGHFCFEDITLNPAQHTQVGGEGKVKASMDGAIVDILVKQGDMVEKGQTVVVLEAMKMEHQLKASVSGKVDNVNVKKGDQVKAKQVLVNIQAEQVSS